VDVNRFLKNWVPTGAVAAARRCLNVLRPADWEYVPEGFRKIRSVRGWNVEEIARKQLQTWSAYRSSLAGAGPLGLNHENLRAIDAIDLRQHNTLVSYAYVLALAARMKPQVALLDWGGGLGHYYCLSKTLLPSVDLDYHCVDVAAFCRLGQQLIPEGRFVDLQKFTFDREFDLVVASSSLWYEEDWKTTLDRLISAAGSYLYVTRMIFVEKHSSFVAIQRPYALGYGTEYLCWILNRREFVDHVSSQMDLVREFLIWEGPHIHRAPEQGDYRGFLFRRRSKSDSGETVNVEG
jgi:putative methyltransferase (TIGR04325 family)